MNHLLPNTSPFRDGWQISCRLGQRRTMDLTHERTRLYGVHKMRYPLLALQVSQDLGPARHALSQRVVSGTMNVRYPFRPVRVPRADGGKPHPNNPRST
jgi:hypothetical protein